MGCTSCGDKPANTAKDFTKAVIEINNPETLVLLRKVVIPASMGTDEDVVPSIGKYRNVVLSYESNGHVYLYSSDGIPTLLTSDATKELEERIAEVSENLSVETTNRQNADNALGNRLTTVEGIASTAVQPDDINQTLVTDIAIDQAVSTSTVKINESKINLSDKSASSDSVTLPVASASRAGIMNSSTYVAVSNNTNNINAILNGAVAIASISANPTQTELTNRWLSETGISTLINRASIYDTTNDKVWTYYSNTAMWYAASNTAQVTVNTFTNSSEGVIKGSTNTGQVFAENDGTGSINGWDALSNNVSTNANNISSLQTTVAGKQNTLTAGSNISISGNTISATDTTYSAGTGLSLSGTTFNVDTSTIATKNDIPAVNDATLTIQQNGNNVATFTANSSTNAVANITSPIITMSSTDPGEGSPLAENTFIAVYNAN